MNVKNKIQNTCIILTHMIQTLEIKNKKKQRQMNKN